MKDIFNKLIGKVNNKNGGLKPTLQGYLSEGDMKNIFNKKFIIPFTLIMVAIIISTILVVNHLNQVADFTKISDNLHSRVWHTSSLLPNGNVLVVGGLDDDLGGGPTDTAEIYDPKTQNFSITGNMLVKRSNPQSVLLKNGKVLVLGGVDDLPMYKSQMNIAELYDYKTGKFIRTGDVNIPRWDGFKLTLLNDGKILITGGLTPGYKAKKDNCEIYDPKTGKFKLISSMKHERSYHTATLLRNGNVLITGGNTKFDVTKVTSREVSAGAGILASTEIFNPKTEKFSLDGNLVFKRSYGNAVLLKDGNILIIGGSGKKLDDNKFYDTTNSDREFYPKNRKYYTKPHGLDTAEIYDTKKNKVVKIIKMNARHGSPTVNVLKDGNILIFGTNQKDKQKIVNTGYSTIYTQEDNDFEEIFDIKNHTFKKIKSIGYSRGHHSATTLKNGQVLIVGGTSYPRHNIPNLLFEYKGE